MHHQGDGGGKPAQPAGLDFAVIKRHIRLGAGIGDKVLDRGRGIRGGADLRQCRCGEGRPGKTTAVQQRLLMALRADEPDVQAWIEERHKRRCDAHGAQELDIPEIAEPVTLKVGASPSPHAEILEHVKPPGRAQCGADIVELMITSCPTPVEDVAARWTPTTSAPAVSERSNADRARISSAWPLVALQAIGIYPGKTASLDVFGK